MKISEIIVEATYAQGKAAMDRVLSPSKWIKPGPEYYKGKATMDKILSPSKWFSGSDSKSQTATTSTVPRTDVNHALNAAATDQPLLKDDVAALQNLYQQVKQGSIKTSIDVNQLAAALKAAYSGQQLNDQQKALIVQFSKQI